MTSESVRLDLLHAVRLRGLVEAAELARVVGWSMDRVCELLESEQRRGTVVHRDGRLSGWTLSSSGRLEGERLVRRELELTGDRRMVESGYDSFLELNSHVLSICSDWQTRIVAGERIVNDHEDPGYDRQVLDRLDLLHGRAVQMLQELERGSSRFSGYVGRLSLARGRILDGETEWLTRSTIESYHSVWFELHENLLATLGRTREDDRANGVR